MNRLNVLLLSPSVTRAGGGVPFVVKAHARALAACDGVTVRVLALEDGPLSADELADWNGIDLTTCSIVGTKRFGFSPSMLRHALVARPDVIHVHGIWQFQCAVALSKYLSSKTPYFVSPHGMLEPWIRSRSRAMKAAVSALYQDRFLRRAYAFHALTAIEAQQVCELVPGALAPVIPNFVEPAVADAPPPRWWQKEWAGRDVFVFLGRLHEKKGCLELCEAWDILCRDPGFREKSVLVFCGPADGIPEFEARVEAAQARWGNIHFAGPQYGVEKERTLARATFLCLPSKSEGLPVTILEGWAAGSIAIMTRACNLDIGFERDAALETGTDAPAIAATLSAASAMPPNRRDAMAANARVLVKQDFSSVAVTSKLLDLYHKAVV